jgi:hypothetical protein
LQRSFDDTAADHEALALPLRVEQPVTIDEQQSLLQVDDN